MRVASAAASILILSASTVWAQSTQPVTTSAGTAFGGRPVGSRMVMASPPENRMTSVQTAVAQKRMQEMESTLKAMHGLLQQMRAKAAKSSSKDPFAKANLEMWQLLLGHLDQQFKQLRTTTLASEDLNARRASMYRQAAAKAAAEAARASSASPTATGTAEQGTVSAGQAVSGATTARDETQATSTPASSTPK